MAPPPFRITDDQRATVKAMAAYGVPEDDIAKVIGCDPKTLRKHCRQELDTAHIQANAQVAGWLFKKCQAGDTASLIFWLKTRAKWKEPPQELRHGGSEEAGPIRTETIRRVLIDPKAGTETDI